MRRGQDPQEEQVAVRAHGLRKSYGSLVALDGVSVEASRGRIFAYPEPNDAAKLSMVNAPSLEPRVSDGGAAGSSRSSTDSRRGGGAGQRLDSRSRERQIIMIDLQDMKKAYRTGPSAAVQALLGVTLTIEQTRPTTNSELRQ